MNNKVTSSEVLNKVREISNLKDMLYDSAKMYKDNIAFKYKEDGNAIEVKYEEFKNDVNALGTSLLDLGLKDEKIALIGINSYKWCTSYLGTVCGTGIIVPIDKALPLQEIRNLITASKASTVFFDSKYLDIFKEIKKEGKTNLKHLICFGNDVNDKDVISFDSLIRKGKELIEKNDTSFIDIKVDNKVMNMLLYTSRYNI